MKKIIIIIVIIAAALVAWMLLKPKATNAPSNTTASADVVGQDLSSIDLGNLDSDFKDIDTDLKTL